MKSWRCDIKLKIICITTAEAIRSGKEDIKYEKKDSYVKRLYYGDQHISNCISCWYFYFFIPVYSIRSQKILRSEFLQMCHARVNICGQYLILIIST